MIMRKDLVDISDTNYDTRRNEFMQCQDCGEDFGGTQGDFFMMSDDALFYCPECGSDNIAIVRRVCKNVIIKQ